MSGFRLSPQILLALVTLVLQWPEETTANNTMPLSSLFDKAIDKAIYLNELVRVILLEYKMAYINKNEWEVIVPCRTDAFGAPTKKDEVLKKTDAELLRFSVLLIHRWLRPVQYFEPLFELENYISSLIVGRPIESARGETPVVLPNYDTFGYTSRDYQSLQKHYGHLFCLKKALHMVEMYLNVMKSRHSGGN